MVSKIYRRIIFLIVLALTLVGLTIVTKRAPNNSITQTSVHLFDSITHLHSSTNDNQKAYEIEKAQLNHLKNDHNKNKKVGKHNKHNEQESNNHRQVDLDLDACTVLNPLSHGFIDLRSLSNKGNDGKALPWTARGYDSGNNYTLGICSSPFKQHHNDLNEVKDNVNSSLIGGFYIEPKTGKYVSIGQYATKPQFKGRKLTLTYENGSYCDSLINSSTGEKLRKSTILTFTCDREILAKAHVLYIGSINNCDYIFEVRSHHACPTAAKADNLAAVWIFFLIFIAALAVYFSGGFFYKQMKSFNRLLKGYS